MWGALQLLIDLLEIRGGVYKGGCGSVCLFGRRVRAQIGQVGVHVLANEIAIDEIELELIGNVLEHHGTPQRCDGYVLHESQPEMPGVRVLVADESAIGGSLEKGVEPEVAELLQAGRFLLG